MRLPWLAHRTLRRQHWRVRNILFVTVLSAVLLLVGHLFHSPAGHSYKLTEDVNATYVEPADEVLFPVKPLVIWSSNFHPAPVHDLTTLLEPLGVHFIHKDVSTKYCQHFNTCSAGANVRVINSDNILSLKDYKACLPFCCFIFVINIDIGCC